VEGKKRKAENRNPYEDNTNLIMEMGGHGEEGRRRKKERKKEKNKMERKERTIKSMINDDHLFTYTHIHYTYLYSHYTHCFNIYMHTALTFTPFSHVSYSIFPWGAN
jgi:hypothetical protein